jgi:hypothetical protein
VKALAAAISPSSPAPAPRAAKAALGLDRSAGPSKPVTCRTMSDRSNGWFSQLYLFEHALVRRCSSLHPAEGKRQQIDVRFACRFS